MTIIRVATVERDLASLVRLNGQVHAEHARQRPDLFVVEQPTEELAVLLAARLAEPDATCFVAEAPDGTVVGYAFAKVISREANAIVRAARAVMLDQIGVDPAAARAGVGAALLEAVRELGRSAGCGRLVTQVWDFNEGARAFYQAAGLRPMTTMLDQRL
ncbi:GNAT family N-acetyltransferase [Kitasatospora sp. MMS16-BH015]|uniref:GNAT family N-acetyltransferase n=1 Tax=Kitasatospora sp. MMS16-BH015 TaxID=2018025 RepID=UPI000CA283BF|nr:GNAT family N-acetyltransferase [Kitasatospora sp. MMS16-BH015]